MTLQKDYKKEVTTDIGLSGCKRIIHDTLDNYVFNHEITFFIDSPDVSDLFIVISKQVEKKSVLQIRKCTDSEWGEYFRGMNPIKPNKKKYNCKRW